jgi:tetratricopeptide (TPR) repeat protein
MAVHSDVVPQLLAAGRLAEAISLLSEQFARSPQDVEIRAVLVSALWLAGMRTDAERLLTQSSGRSELENSVLDLHRAWILQEKGHFEEALRATEHIMPSEELVNRWNYVSLRAGFYANVGDVEAIKALLYSEDFPVTARAEASSQAISVLLARRQTDLAALVLEGTPEEVLEDARMNRGKAHMAAARRDWAKAFDFYEQYVAVEPYSAEARMGFALAAKGLKRYDIALPELESLLDVPNVASRAWWELAGVYLPRGAIRAVWRALWRAADAKVKLQNQSKILFGQLAQGQK